MRAITLQSQAELLRNLLLEDRWTAILCAVLLAFAWLPQVLGAALTPDVVHVHAGPGASGDGGATGTGHDPHWFHWSCPQVGLVLFAAVAHASGRRDADALRLLQTCVLRCRALFFFFFFFFLALRK
jgi:hypothetical protein